MSDIKNMVCGEESNMSKKCVKPHIRFAGFDEEWERRKLGEVAEIVGGGTPSTSIKDYWDGDIDWYTPAEIAEQIYITSSQRKITEEGYNHSSAKMLPVGTVLFTSRAGIGKTVILSRKGCTNQGFQSIVPHKDKLDSYFIFSRGEELKKYGETIGAGSTFIEVSGKQMANMELMLPKIITEQQVIGAYFEKLNKLITLHQRKYDKLVNIKKSMLEKMFPKNGSNVPEVRFKGFSGDWEWQKFNEVFDCTIPNNTLPRSELNYESGLVKNIHYGDILIKYGAIVDVQNDEIPFVTGKNSDDFKGALLQDGDIIIADTAEDDTTGKACEINNLQGLDVVSGLHTMVCRPRNKMALGYIGYYINSDAYRFQIFPLMQGIKVLSLSKTNIQKTMVSYPTNMAEQQQIANYFRNLDKIIALHQRKVEKLQNIKKACLEKMFI